MIRRTPLANTRCLLYPRWNVGIALPRSLTYIVGLQRGPCEPSHRVPADCPTAIARRICPEARRVRG